MTSQKPEATLEQEKALLDWMASYEPVEHRKFCKLGCGRSVAKPGPCLKCRNNPTSPVEDSQTA